MYSKVALSVPYTIIFRKCLPLTITRACRGLLHL
jgi:choline-glycine betaine transporter